MPPPWGLELIIYDPNPLSLVMEIWIHAENQKTHFYETEILLLDDII